MADNREPRDDKKRHEMNPETIFPTSDPEYSLTGDALHREEIEQGGVGTDPAPKEGMKRYPTESPDEPADHEE
jgi:hypothetical protein